MRVLHQVNDLQDFWLLQIAIICGVFSEGLFSLFRKKKESNSSQHVLETRSDLLRSIEGKKIELLLPNIKKEIASFAIKNLREAAERGESEPDLDSLLKHYEEEFRVLDEKIYPKELELKLLELEEVKSKLKTFLDDKINELNSKIEELNSAIESGLRQRFDYQTIKIEELNAELKAITKGMEEHKNDDLEKKLEIINKEVLMALERLERLESEG